MWVALRPQKMQMYLTITGPNTLGPDLRDLRPTTPNVASTIFYDSSAIYDADADAATSLLGQFSHDLAPSMPIE
jgi:hypothetical protein